MPSPGTMGAVSEDEENPSPSLSLLQRLKRLREWQERQQKELLQTQAYAHTSTGPYLPPVLEESQTNLEATLIEDSTPAPAVPQRVEDHCTPAELPGVGPASPVVPVTSDLQVKFTGIEDFTSTSTAGPQGYHTPAGSTGVGPASLVVPVASVHLVKSPLSLPEKVNAGWLEEDIRDNLPTHDKPYTGKVDAGNKWEREGSTSERQASPLSSPGSYMVADALHPLQYDPEKCDRQDERDVRETESEYDTLHTTDTQEETPYSLPSASLSPHEDPNKCLDESMEDLLGGEERVPYRSDKYKSAVPNKEGLRTPEPSQVVKNLMPSRPFFSALTKGSEDGPEGMEEPPRPRRRFLKKGQGTARFKMRPMRLRRPTTEAEEECGWQGGRDVPQAPSPARTPTRSQFRLPVQSLHLLGAPPALDGQRSYRTQGLQGTPKSSAEPVLAPTRQSTHPARPSAPAQHPSTCPTTQNPARPPASTLQPSQATTQRTTKPPPTLRDVEKQQRKEEVELSAFEKLEELADDSSFSSNSSTVWGLLRQGQQSVSSTPLRTPPPLALQETPVVGSLNAKPKNLAESHFNEGLAYRVMPPVSASQQQQAASPVDVREVLAQLKAIVRLEGHSISDITESDIQSFLDSHQPSHVPHQTSTPVSPQPALPPQARPHHVHFASEGVQVMEYQLSDTEGEDTLTDATSLDSDMMTTSDLEALTQLNIRGATADPDRQQGLSCRETNSSDTSSSGEATLTEQEPPQNPQPVVLNFSPPPPRPPQSASNYIWSIFGKERDAKKLTASKPASKKTTKEALHQPPPKPPKAERRNVPSASQASQKADAGQEELEVHKTLLLAKVAELEKETKQFKKDNAKLKKLQQDVEQEKQKLEEEKWKFHEETASERRRFQEYVDRERNALWSERQRVIQQPSPPVTQPQEHVMEVIRLREQVRLMQEEAERKESLNQFTVKKLNNRIKTLENENRRLQDRNKSLQALEKENQDLRLKVDRAKAGGRTRLTTQPALTNKATQGRPKTGIRPTTVDGVTKTLDRLTKPQPVVIKDAQTKAKSNKQDLTNNNLKIGPVESDEAMLKQGSNAKAHLPHTPDQDTLVAEEPSCPTPAADDLKHSEGQSLLPSVPGCSEDPGLEHTERLREDGVREVIYANGNRKEIYPSGDVTVSFYNGDRKEVKADRTVYVYGSDHTSHTTFSDGREELIFPNGQQETRHPDGSSEILFPDGSRKSVMSDGMEICTTKDGSVVRTNPDGSKVFEFPSGQREVHRGGEKRREYPNGTVKIVHPDGRTETRYNSGRIRIRDREGNVILDTHVNLSPPHPSSLPS